jgi:hypothetical protein
MKDSARYVKIIEWSDEDECFVGSCPGLLDGGCHGDDEASGLIQARTSGLARTPIPEKAATSARRVR